MAAIPKPDLPERFRNELARLARAGFSVIPLGGGADGKSPLVGTWSQPKISLRQVFGPLYRTGSQMYGIRLDKFVVVDCDEDSPELVAQLEARFGPSPVHVKTPRGRHLYYRALCGEKAPNLRAEGLPVDIKTGANAYVVGPLSTRLDGGCYVPTKGVLGENALPPLKQAPQPRKTASRSITVGDRHNALVKEAIEMVEYVDSVEELEANLIAVRDDLCEDASTMPDSEVASIADWAWRKRLDNMLFKGRNSVVSLNRLALDALRRWNNEADAIALYVLLQDMHGHRPGKLFALDFKGMKSAGLTSLSVPRLRAARRTLQTVGLLRLVGKHKAGSKHQTFALSKKIPTSSDTPNVIQMGTVGKPLVKGGGS